MPTRVCMFDFKNKTECPMDNPPRRTDCTKCCEYVRWKENNSMANDLEQKPQKDIISHPSHYIDGRKYEPKDVIRDWDLNFNLGSAVKYISRADRKDDILQDLKKAKQFLEFEIEALEKERTSKEIAYYTEDGKVFLTKKGE